MCGIAGLFRPGGIDPVPAEPMTRALAHRGPDDVAVRVLSEGGRPYAALGAQRLAIVDPSGGHQPTRDHTGRFVVALNGEVYNHCRLRTELAAHDIPFRSEGDTEVLANLVQSHGFRTALDRLRGMFAAAIVDTAERRLYLVRDRLGKKPLYWTRLPDGTIAWASELRSLLLHPKVERRLDRRAIDAFLLFEYIPTPWTPWQGIHKLEPGTCLEVDEAGARPWRWWTPPLPTAGGGSMKHWSEAVAGSLQVAVMQRMQADVEVGYLLSGGLDSTSVVALAAERSPRPVRTFSVAVDAPGFDEGPEARRVAATLGTEHREARLGPGDVDRLVAEITAHMDEPLADSSLLPTWRLMELVREAGVKCVLSGDGADESFAGYPTYLAHRIVDTAGPLLRKRVVRAAARRLPTTFEGVTSDYMARRFADGLGLPWARRHQVWMGAWLPGEIGAAPAAWEVVDRHAARVEGADPVGRALYLDQRLYMSDGVLVKVDRASMAHGVEVRCPFLDHFLVELAAEVPTNLKLRGGEGKAVLRKAVEDLVPADTLRRPKQGFGGPVGPWLRGPCRHLLDDLAESVEGLLEGDLVRRISREHVDGVADHRRRLWSAFILGRWRASRWGT